MAKQKKDKNGVCVFCGTIGIVTDDHVPPKNLFAGLPNEGLIKVPGCKPCNQGSSKDDEYFRTFLIPQEGVASHPQARELNRIVRDKFDSSDRKGLERRMNSQLQIKDVFTPSGIYLGKKNLIYPEYGRIDAILKKILKGLYFHETKNPFPSGLSSIAAVDVSQIETLQEKIQIDLGDLVRELANCEFTDIHGVFLFKSLFKSSPFQMSVWHLTFFGKRQYFGITYPRSFGVEVKLVDSDPNEHVQIGG